VAVLLAAAAVLGPLAWRYVRATGGLRRDWDRSSAEDFRAAVMPAAGTPGGEAEQPAEMAGHAR
jgi:hypothetical protein